MESAFILDTCDIRLNFFKTILENLGIRAYLFTSSEELKSVAGDLAPIFTVWCTSEILMDHNQYKGDLGVIFSLDTSLNVTSIKKLDEKNYSMNCPIKPLEFMKVLKKEFHQFSYEA